MSRFQLLVFTFVIGIGLFFIVLRTNPANFPAIDNSVLLLLGISGSSYLVSKGIQFSQPDGLQDRRVIVTPVAVQLKEGESHRFAVKVAGDATVPVTWSVDGAEEDVGTITQRGVYKANKASDEPVVITATTQDGAVGTAGVLQPPA